MVGRYQVRDIRRRRVLHIRGVLRKAGSDSRQQAYLVFKITSRLKRDGYRIKDISATGLPKESVIRTDILVPISVSDLRYRMGVLSRADRVGLRSYLNGHDSPRIMGRKRSSNRL